MSELSDRISAQLEKLGLSVADVHRRLDLAGFRVPYSTLAGWFNGSRGVKMKQLKALCDVLETTISEMLGEDLEAAQNKIESLLLRETRGLDQLQQEAVLALIRSMRGRKDS